MPPVYALSLRQLYEQVIADVRDGKAVTIHPELYRAYSENLVSGVSGVFAPSSNSDKYLDMQIQFEANTARFAAYKAFHATQQLQRQLADADGVARSPEDFDRMARAVLNTFNRYQAAEYNTAVARARSAKQWTDFSQPDNMFLFPNLRWIPSRSADPREQHIPFYNRVWAKNDPFWNSNQPGNLWNCKCDWEETDDPVTDGNPEGLKPAKGLEGNPAKTGQIFTDQCTYVKKAKEYSDVNALYRDQMVEQAKNIDKTVSVQIGGQQHEVTVNKVGITESVKKSFGNPDYWLRNKLLEHIGEWLPKANYVTTEPIDLTHNSGKTLKLKKRMEKAHKLQLDLGRKSFWITIFEYRDSGKMLFYCIEPI